MKIFGFKSAIFAMAMLFALGGCGNSGDSKTELSVLKVGTNAEFPPFEFVDNKNQITGFDIDLLNEFSRRSGVKIEMQNMNFDALIPALKFGKIDAAISGMSATPQRREAVDFSKAYYSTENLFLRRKGDERLKSPADLDGKSVAVLLGSVQELAAKEIKGAILLPADSVTANVQALKAGRADAVVIDSSIGYGFIKQNDDIEAFFTAPDGSDGFAVAFDKDKFGELINSFNAFLEEIKKDGTYDKLLEKYDLK